MNILSILHLEFHGARTADIQQDIWVFSCSGLMRYWCSSTHKRHSRQCQAATQFRVQHHHPAGAIISCHSFKILKSNRDLPVPRDIFTVTATANGTVTVTAHCMPCAPADAQHTGVTRRLTAAAPVSRWVTQDCCYPVPIVLVGAQEFLQLGGTSQGRRGGVSKQRSASFPEALLGTPGWVGGWVGGCGCGDRAMGLAAVSDVPAQPLHALSWSTRHIAVVLTECMQTYMNASARPGRCCKPGVLIPFPSASSMSW